MPLVDLRMAGGGDTVTRNQLSVVIVNQHMADALGGSEIQCDLIARGLMERGHRVTYIAVGGTTSWAYETPYPVVPVAPTATEIADACLRFSPDVVYWRFNKHCFADAVKPIHRAGVPVVFSVSHVRDVSRWYLQPGFQRRLRLRTIRRALKETYRLFREHRGFDCVAGLVTNNPDYLGRVPVAVQEYIPNSMSTAAEAFEWPRPYCVWVANVKARKQPERYVELARALADGGTDFLMVGKIQDTRYRPLLSPENVPPNFHYLGEKSLPQVNGILASSLFLVHTCLPEGFSNNMIQAWLQARPVVSLAFDPAGLIVSQGLGFYAAGNMSLFVDQTRRLIDDARLRGEIGARANAFASRSFSAEKNIDRLADLLQRVAAARLHGDRRV
jgi:glycosyltransferase involved in cell wall biosynthesis